MELKQKITIFEHFKDIKDPRIERTKRHKLIDIIIITICAVISGADTWEEIAGYGESKIEWLKTFLELPNGIPSHDTMNRVFARLNPDELQKCFLEWVKSISQLTAGEIVSIDGKTLCHSSNKNSSQLPIHMVSAWANVNNLVLGQVKVKEKSNEITAIPELLKILSLSGCLITIDAMGCQKNIVSEIVSQKADYLITLKNNQRKLLKRVETVFKEALSQQYEGFNYSDYRKKENNHGREETRYYQVLNNIQAQIDPVSEWANLNSICRVDYLRTLKNGKTRLERRYYLSSCCQKAEFFANSIRGHWGIENKLNWVLDVQFNEDDSKIRKDNAPENLARIRQIALNLINQEKTVKNGVKNKRKRAGWDNDYLLKILAS